MTPTQTLVAQFYESYPMVRYGKGQIIWRPSETVDKVHYLLEGSVIQYDISPAGNIIILNSFKPETFFPMSNVLNDVATEYFFEAATPASARVAPAEAARQFLIDHPEVTFDLLARVYHGTDGILRRMSQLMGGSAISRLTYELINAGYRFGETNSQSGVYIPLSESDIARRAGLSRETVSRTMRQLKAKCQISAKDGGIYIPDISHLENLLDELN